MNKVNQQPGFALLMTLIVVTVILSIGTTILEISIKSLALTTSAVQSEYAFHAANAGLECVRYWKDDDVERLNFEAGSDVTLNCFETSDVGSNSNAVANVGSGGSVYTYEFELDYGTPARCSQAFVAVLVSPDDSNRAAINPTPTTDFPWEEGLTTCPGFGTCTIAYVRGYNTTCTAVNSGVGRFLQREILLEF